MRPQKKKDRRQNADGQSQVFGFSGGGKGSRTPDLIIANDALYQLSYTPLLVRQVEVSGLEPLTLALQRRCSTS